MEHKSSRDWEYQGWGGGDGEESPTEVGPRWDTKGPLKPFPLQDSPLQLPGLWNKTTGAELIGEKKVILN